MSLTVDFGITFIAWIIYFILTYNFGALLKRILRIEKAAQRGFFGVTIQSMLGLAAVSFIFGVWSFFLPVNGWLTLGLILIALLQLFDRTIQTHLLSAYESFSNLTLVSRLLFGLLFFVVLYISAGPSLNYDTGLYHVPFINWIQHFSVVPGLANLHGRFGFNSHWHLIEAGLNGFPFLSRPLNDLGGVFAVLLIASSIESIQAIYRESGKFHDHIIALFFFPMYLLFRFFSSDSPDLPNAIFGFVVLSLVWADHGDVRSKLLTMVVVGTLLVTFKVTAVFLLLAALPYFIQVQMRTRLIALGLGLLLIGPWLGRNVVQTGYLVFPAKFTAIGNLDYRVPAADMDHMDTLLKAHGRHGTYAVERINEPVNVWFMEWFNMQTRVIQIILIMSVLFSIILSLHYAMKLLKEGIKEHNLNHLVLQAIMIISLVVWFAKGPNPRYIYGVLIFYSAYLLSLLVMRTSRHLVWAFVAVGMALSMNLFRVILNEAPAPFETPELMSIESGDARVLRPIGTDQCADAIVPCASIDVVGLELRGSDLKDGFRITGR